MEAPPRFGRYTVTGTLGHGAMGHVYAAVDDVLGRAVAVKTLRGGTGGDSAGARVLDERFRLEARAIAALNHPGIVQVYDIDLAAEPPYLVMERMTGPSLKERGATGPVSANELRGLGIQIARALAAAHAAGIVHRDVKPANILAAGPGAWKLADFGVAHVPDSSLTMTGQFLGSPAYAPPEALVRGQCTAAGDVFGLAASLYYAAAGRWPRTEATTAGLLAPVPAVRSLVPDLPEDLAAILDRALAIEPDRRPTAAALADALAGAPLPIDPPAPRAVDTQFVPDATIDRMPVRALTPPAATETAFVADGPRGAAPIRWRRWAIGGGVLALALLLVATRGGAPSSVPAGSAAAVDPARPALPAPVEDPPEELPPPGQIVARTPPLTDRQAAKDWSKLVDALYEREFRKARERLDEWERRWGASPETRSLRKQLDALPPEVHEDD